MHMVHAALVDQRHTARAGDSVLKQSWCTSVQGILHCPGNFGEQIRWMVIFNVSHLYACTAKAYT
jgi:hypothetical protein